MARESVVLAVVGVRRLSVFCWGVACFILGGLAFIFCGLIVLLLIAQAAFVATGLVASLADATGSIVVKVIAALILFALGFVFAHLFKRARKKLAVPIERDIDAVAHVIVGAQNRVKANMSYAGDALRSAAQDNTHQNE